MKKVIKDHWAKPRSVKFTDALWAKVHRFAALNEVPASEYIRSAIEKYMADDVSAQALLTADLKSTARAA